MHRLLPILAILLLTAGCSLPGASGDEASPPLHHPNLTLGEIPDGADDNPQLFTAYNPGGPCRWNQGWPWKYDMTGVSWDRPTTCTAITPRHVVMASHFQRNAGTPVVFHDRKGRRHERRILQTVRLKDAGLNTDISIGLLDRPLPKPVRTYPLLEPDVDNSQALRGARVLVTEQDRRLFFHMIAAIHGNAIHLRFDKRLDESRRKILITGDSGNPSFILTRGELALVETHTSGGGGSGPFYGSAEVVGTIRRVAAELDPAYPIRTVAIDEKVKSDAREGAKDFPQARPAPAKVAPATPPPASRPEGPRKPRIRVIPPAG